MWTERRVVTVDPRPWAVIGLWVWFWPGLALVLGKGLDGLVLFLIAMLARFLAVVLYNRLAGWHQGVHIVQDSGSMVKIRLGRSWRALTLYGLVTGAILGVGVGLIFGRVLMWVVLAAVLTLLTQALTVLLYNGIVVPFYGGWQWQEAIQREKWRVLNFTPNQTRLLFATLLFAWTAVILVLLIVVATIFFAAVRRALPQGFFSLGVIVFASFFVAILGFVLSVIYGWWCFWGVTWYNRWAARGGGIQMTVETQEISL